MRAANDHSYPPAQSLAIEGRNVADFTCCGSGNVWICGTRGPRGFLLEELRAPRLDEINHLAFQVCVVKPIDFLHSRRAGDVHFGQVVADYVEANKVKPVLLKPGLQRLADLPVTCGHRRFNAGPAHVNVPAMFVVARYAQGTTQRFAVQHDQALVAAAHFGHVSLRHYGPSFEAGYRFQNRTQVPVAAMHEEHALAAVSVERLYDHLATLIDHKFSAPGDLVGHDRRRDHRWKVQRVKLFVCFAQPGGVVKHEGALWIGQRQQHGCVKVGRVGRRVLAHEHCLEGLDWIVGSLVEKSKMRRRAFHFATPRVQLNLPLDCVKIAQSQKVNLMASPLGLEHEDEGGVLVDQHPFERVHDESELVHDESLLAGCLGAPLSVPYAPAYRALLFNHCPASTSAAIAAVSLRSRFGPKPTATNPAATASSSSSCAKSPSGPEVISRPPGLSVPIKRVIGSDPAEQINASVSRGTRRIKVAKGTASRTCIGGMARLCLAAAAASRCQRRIFSLPGTLPTVLVHTIGHNSVAASSAAFSTKKSIRGPFTMAGATIRGGRGCADCDETT